MTTVIQLYGKSFSIGFSESDDARRQAYFKSGTGNLTPQEKALLLSIGVDSMLENSLKPYLTKFFSSLQTCSGDASLVLNRDCETAYFVIWSALFHNRAEVARRMKDHSKEVIGDLDLATDAAIIKGLKPRVPPPPPKVNKNTVNDLFTLMLLGTDVAPAGAASVRGATDSVNKLFSLMLLDESVATA
jgi:hypothetical protein